MAPRAQTYDYDVLVIGSGPAGQRAAIQAAKVDKRVALIEKKSVLGGVSVNTGTIPSKTLREAVLDLSGYGEREFYGLSHTLKKRIDMPDLLVRVDAVVRHEIDVTRAQLLRNRVDVISATASFQDSTRCVWTTSMAQGNGASRPNTSSSPPERKRRAMSTSLLTAAVY